MLRGLDIRNMLIIDQLSLEFTDGLNVLTGETGAGKSILLDSLGFVLGWRGHADLVRQGQDQGEVTAWFDIPHDHPARAILNDAGITCEDELILRRVNTRDGRKTAWINDRRVSGDVLRNLSDTLVELHGQHDDRGLLDPQNHRAILDAFDGAEGMMGDALRWLDDAADRAEGRLDEPISALNRAMIELQEAADGVDRALEALDFNPHELEQTEERLFALRRLARKHQIAPDDLAQLCQTLSDRLTALDRGADHLDALTASVRAAERDYDAAAQRLSAARHDAATRLDHAMVAELGPLKMERAQFSTQITAGPAGGEGMDQVDFVVATNPGAPSGSLIKIASGGELSRFLLALKVCLSGTDARATMIFDEIDRGVGGATADAVGRRLAALAEGGQVLVVTHSPQVAALGRQHFQVSKDQREDETISNVMVLDPQARVDEIARMISGDRITDAARDAARALIGGA
jgi:DNA repair ATPase RecN